MARVLCTIFAKTKNRDWKPGDGTKTLEHHTDRPEPARDQARPADHRKDDTDPQRDARRFRPTKSPGPPDTSAPGSGRVQGRPLRTQAHRQGRQTRAEGAETQGHPVLVRGDRTLPAVHGAFHAQRALKDAADPQGMGVRRYLDMSRLDDNLTGAN